ncbi:hypothetical protein JCM3774_001347 [Rhodotorula dairenensis]
MHPATRRLPPTLCVKLDPAAESAPLALPGLISSLRPIRRMATQLADEAALLRRFMYKHKNQHKGQRWWKRIVEVDRCTSRALAELSGWLTGFGMSLGTEDHGSIGRQELCRGLLAVPRVLLIVEKNVHVLLNCAGILEQLVDSRAFLAFALVVVALAARLHTLFSVLFDDLDRAAATLAHLVETNRLMDVVKPHLERLPRELRRFVPSDRVEPRADKSAPTSETGTPLSSVGGGADDLGSVVARPLPTSRLVGGSSKSATPALPSRPVSRTASPAVNLASPVANVHPPESDTPARGNKTAEEWANSEGIVQRRNGSQQLDGQGVAVPRKRSLIGLAGALGEDSIVKKRVRAELAADIATQPSHANRGPSAPRARTASDKAVVKSALKKKKKKVKKGGDEIDDIFG